MFQGLLIMVKKLPRWQVRRLRLLDKAFKAPEFEQLILDIQNNVLSKDEAAKSLFEIMPKINLPGDCFYIAIIVLNEPSIIKDHEYIRTLLSPPIKWTSFRNKMRGPSPNPKMSFLDWHKSRSEHIDFGYDPLENDSALLLEIKPSTTKEELLNFIDEYFEDEIKPQLSIKSHDEYYYPEVMKSGRRITDMSTYEKRTESIIQLYKSGLKPKEIAEHLPGDIESSNVRTILSRLRKSGRI